MPALENPRWEKFAQARFQGLESADAFRATGYKGRPTPCGARLSRMPEIQARIAELNEGVAKGLQYEKTDLAHDLLTVIRSTPRMAGPDHPLAEPRKSHSGKLYYRFPCKLRAAEDLMKLMGWDAPVKVAVAAAVSSTPATENPMNPWVELLEFIRKRKGPDEEMPAELRARCREQHNLARVQLGMPPSEEREVDEES